MYLEKVLQVDECHKTFGNILALTHKDLFMFSESKHYITHTGINFLNSRAEGLVESNLVA